VEVLAVTFPLQLRMIALIRPPFRQRLADPETAGGGPRRALLFRQAAEPPLPRIVFPVPPEHTVDAVDEVPGAVHLAQA
jgi:hypothetical protein